MKHAYFAGPISNDPSTAIKGKEAFLMEYGDMIREHNVNVLSPHMMYGWINQLDGFDGKGSEVEQYALEACLQFIERHDLDAIVFMTAEGEESQGMQAEKELAAELGIPSHHLPYFSTRDGITVDGIEKAAVLTLLKQF